MGVHSARSCVCLFLCCFASLAIALFEETGNINVREPITRVSPAKGDRSDQFGATILFHRTADVVLGDMQQSLNGVRLIVAAPLGSYPGGVDCNESFIPCNASGSVPITGLIYNCAVEPGKCGPLREPNTTSKDDAALFDDTGDFGGNNENKTLQLLGLSMYSTESVFLVCAPRWLFRAFGAESQVRGKCYFTLNRNLSGPFLPISPCVAPSGGSRNLNSGSGNTIGVGFCLSGTGATVIDDVLFMGTPHVNFEQGGLAAFDTANYQNITMSTDQRNGASNDIVPSELDEDELFRIIVNGSFADVRRATDIGFFLLPGRVFDPNTISLLASVPRWDSYSYTGNIQVYDPTNIQDASFTATENVHAETLAEFFGYDFTVADLNGDGLDELIVGAPMYSDVSNIDVHDVGRVYLFWNDGGVYADNPVKLQTNLNISRFGQAVEALGDINNDGLEDFAVGAPFEGSLDNDSCSGAVYIYYGSSNVSVLATFGQKITGCVILDTVAGLQDLRTFGYSLTSKADVDGNNYNDLAVGAYDSQTVTVLRSFPLADVNISLAIDPSELRVALTTCMLDMERLSCVNLEVCLTYNGKDNSLSDNLNISYTIRVSGKAFFAPSRGTTIDRTQVLQKGVEGCSTVTVYAQNKNLFDQRDFDEGFLVSVGIKDIPLPTLSVVNGSQPLTDLAATPILRLNGRKQINIPIPKDCAGDICMVDLVLENSSVSFQNIDETIAPSRFVAGATTKVLLKVDVFNNAADAAEQVWVTFIPPDYVDRDSITSKLGGSTSSDCMARNDSSVECRLSLLFLGEERNTLEITLPVLDQLVGNESDDVTLTVESRDPNTTETMEDDNSITFFLRATASVNVSAFLLFNPSSLTYSVSNRPVSNPTNANQLGTTLYSLELRVIDTAPTTVPRIDVELYLPSRSEETGDFYYIYPTTFERTIFGGSANIQCSDTSAINPDMLVVPEQSSRRRRRHTASEMLDRARANRERVTRNVNDDDKNTVQFNCADDLSLCQGPIKCRIENLDPISSMATIPFLVEYYVDERFFFDKKDTYCLQAYAKITIPTEGYEYIMDSSSDNTATATLTLTRDIVPSGFNIHYVIWPAIAALILLIILAVVLYFVGFFRRKKPEKEEGEVEGVADETTTAVPPGPEGKEEVAEL